MGSINIQGVCKQFSTQTVLSGITLELREGEVVGLVGANGSGKTTLLRLMAREQRPDLGTITLSKGLEVGYLSQEPDVQLDHTLHDEVGGAFEDLLELESRLHDLSDQIAVAPHGPAMDDLMKRYDRLSARFETSGGYTFVQRLNEVLGGLGFTETDHALPMSVLSGGQKCRAALGKLLLRDRSFLLLDEPTNHLDIDAVRWLEKFLASHHGGAVVVSHDRYLLDRLVDRVIEIERTRTYTYPGNYSNFAKVKQLRRLTQERQYEKDKEFVEKERAFIAKHLAGQRTKEAQGRRTRLERRIADGEFVLERPSAERKAKFVFDRVESGDAIALRIDDLAKGFENKPLFSELSCQIPTGERFGITGPNGTGKSTLLRIITGALNADAGRIQFGRKVAHGYYEQEAGELDAERLVIEEMRSVRPDMSESEARSYLARFGFRGDDVFKRLGALSGGEQSRVRLIRLIVSSANLMILDEPTNHLDIASCEALEEALSEYPGTIIVVSHDRYFLDRIVDRLLVIRPEGHATYSGNYSYYVEQIEKAQTAAAATASSKQQRKRASRSKAPDKNRERSPFDAYRLEELEQYIVEREETLAAMHDRFADPEVCRDPDSLAQLSHEFNTLKEELAQAETAWSDRADQ